MGLMNGFLSLVTWWNGSTLGTKLYTARNGVKIGEDEEGNIYYESRDGKRRWVMYNGEAEASRVSAEWHGWLHHVFDAPPNKEPLPKKHWQKEHLPNMTGTVSAYAPSGSLRRNPKSPQQDYQAWSPE